MLVAIASYQLVYLVVAIVIVAVVVVVAIVVIVLTAGLWRVYSCLPKVPTLRAPPRAN